jgi:hypothetical protein
MNIEQLKDNKETIEKLAEQIHVLESEQSKLQTEYSIKFGTVRATINCDGRMTLTSGTLTRDEAFSLSAFILNSFKHITKEAIITSNKPIIEEQDPLKKSKLKEK